MHQIRSRQISPKESKEISKRNILRKIEILEDWLRDGIPWEHLDGNEVRDINGNRICIYIPDSLRSFNKWNSERYSNETVLRFPLLTSVLSNGTDTLNNNPELKQRSITILANLSQLTKTQLNSEPYNRVHELDDEVSRLKIFIDNQNNKIIEYHRENIRLTRILSKIEQREKSSIDEIRKNYEKLDNQNSRLREEISVLTKKLNSIYLLKGLDNET
tara:strand:+ start:889 stop:1539 length:651 start_codon:yes stop_codon:yes gene_type:complete